MFRVNYRTGEMSICYVFDEKVVCTPPERAPQPTPAGRATGSEATATTGSSAPRRN